MTLTSKERLTRTLNREPVDRVPVSTYELLPFGHDPWYASQPSYQPLLEFIHENADNLYMWCGANQNAHRWDETSEEWTENHSRFTRYRLQTPKGELLRVTRVDEDIHTVWEIEPLLKSSGDIAKYLSLPWAYGGTDMTGFFEAQTRLGDRGIMLCDTLDPICAVAYAFDFEPFLIQVWENRSAVREMMDAVLERILIQLRGQLEQGAGPLWRVYGPEYVTAPYFPRKDFEELVVAYDKPIIDLIHEFGGKVRLHSHGMVTDILDLVVEMGADAIDPLEPPPQGDVDLADVKKRFGDDLILFGNLELSSLEYWEPSAIEDYVKKCIDEAAAGGGYVAMPTAAPINTPLWERTEQNYHRFIKTVLEYGRYG